MFYATSRTMDYVSTEMARATQNNFLKRLLALAGVFFSTWANFICEREKKYRGREREREVRMKPKMAVWDALN